MNIDNRFFKTPVNHREMLKSLIFLGGGANSDLDFSDKKNKNHGFSLIEMIVVVAILAVMVLVLAPKLLSYNERSRAEKDNSSMDEVVNAIQLALADQEIYDEVLRFSTVDNVSCYVDTNSEANYSKVVTKSNPDGVDQYTFTSSARQLDETPYFAAGNMRGVTITFAPDKGSNGSNFDLKQGVVNQYIQVSGNQRFGAMPKLYNRVKSSVGEVITNTSQTYRNSEYTVFIVMGTIGGKDESAQDATRFYGQWSGTNLPAQVSYQIVSDRTVGDTGNTIVDIDDNNWNTENGNKLILKPGDLNGGGSFTPTTQTGNQCLHTETKILNETDIYTGDEICIGCEEIINTGQCKHANEDIRNAGANYTGDIYCADCGTMLEEGQAYLGPGLYDENDNLIVSWEDSGIDDTCDNADTIIGQYAATRKVVISPVVTSIVDYGFYNCKKITDVIMPDSVTSVGRYCFKDCIALENCTISNNITEISYHMFNYCKKLKSVNIPTGITKIGGYAFESCNLTEIIIPSNTKIIEIGAFSNCKNLQYAEFEDTTTWNIGWSATQLTSRLNSSDLSNPSTAARYLRTGYWNRYWEKR